MKIIRSLLLTICLSVSVLKPMTLKAASTISQHPTTGIVLGSILLAGASTAVYFIARDGCRELCIIRLAPIILVAGLSAVFLDHQDGNIFFKSISSEEGEKWGLSQAETLAFNDEVDEINQVFDFITMEVIHHHEQSPKALRALSYKLWQGSVDQFSDETQSALKKIGNKFR